MGSDNSGGSNERSPRFTFRFSLLALFLLVTLICMLLGWWVQPHRCTVESLFQIRATRAARLGDAPLALDPGEFALLRKTQRELVRSDFVLRAALRDPAIGALPMFKSKSDPLQWLRENLEVESPNDSELLSIRLRCAESMAEDCRSIVDAVSNAYLNQVVFKEEQLRNIERDALVSATVKLKDRLKPRIAELQRLNKNAERDDADVRILQMQVDALSKAYQQILFELEIYDANALAPLRVRRIQEATVQPD